MDDTSFGQWVQRERRSRRLTQAELGTLAGCSAAAIRKIEADERRPSRDVAAGLAAALGVPEADRAVFVQVARGERSLAVLTVRLNAPVAAHLLGLSTDLPVPVRLFGRDHDVQQVYDLIRRASHRLITLTGPGGVGKTSLALRVAAELQLDGACDVALVRLEALHDPHRLTGEIARTLRVSQGGSPTLVAAIARAAGGRRMVLVLDNLEHLVPAAGQLAELLAAVPQLCILATSRVVLHLAGECVVPIAPLAVPPPAASSLDDVRTSPAVSLFVERAAAAGGPLALSAASGATVATICRMLDGLPLAIELAAARTRLLSLRALSERLQQRVGMLGGGSALPDRQRTLTATIDWSYQLLDEAAQRLFLRLAVFSGGATLEAIETVCASGDHDIDLLDGIQTLLDHSLVVRSVDQAGEPRIAMLETLRAYAREQLAAAGQVEALERRHAAYFLAVGEAAEPGLYSRDQVRIFRALSADQHNLRAAWAWMCAHGETELVLRFAGALRSFWMDAGLGHDMRAQLQDLLEHVDPAGIAVQARLRGSFALGLMLAPNWVASEHWCREALALAHEIGDQVALVRARHWIALCLANQGKCEAALQEGEASLRVARTIDHYTGLSQLLTTVGTAELVCGRLEHARALLEEALQFASMRGQLSTAAAAQQWLGDMELDAGAFDGALVYLRPCIQFYRSNSMLVGHAAYKWRFPSGGCVFESSNIHPSDIHLYVV